MSFQPDNQSKIIFLSYHYLKRKGEFKKIWGYAKDLFISHIDWLTKEYPPVGFEQIDKFLKGQAELPAKSSLITFDDGLAEQASFFAPYLAQRKISAAFCVPSCIFDKEMSGVQVVHFLTAKYGIRKFYQALKKHFYVTGLNWHDFFNDEMTKLELMQFYIKVKRILKYKLPPEANYILLKTIYQKELLANDPHIFNKVHLDEPGLKKIIELGHSVACHTYSHRSFTLVNPQDDNFWHKEIDQAKAKLESIINQPVNIFAYPYGGNLVEFDFNHWTRRLKNSGFDYAFNSYNDSISINEFNPYWIERYLVQSQDSAADIKRNAQVYILKP